MNLITIWKTISTFVKSIFTNTFRAKKKLKSTQKRIKLCIFVDKYDIKLMFWLMASFAITKHMDHYFFKNYRRK